MKNSKHTKLFIPGPVEVKDEVLKQLSLPMIGHRSAEYSELQKRLTRKVQKLMFTSHTVVFSTTSGTGLMEMAIRSTTAKRAIVFSIGAFGNRWHDIARGNGIASDKHEAEWGTGLHPETVEMYLKTGAYDAATITHNETSTGAMNHLEELAEVFRRFPDVIWCVDAVSSLGGVKIPVDSLGIDICLTSSQKAMGLPPGISFASVSEKAIQKSETLKTRGYYLDLLLLVKYIRERNYQHPFTPSIPHLFALDYQLDRIEAEGLENRFQRHADIARHVQEWAGKQFALYPDVRYCSQTVTCIKNTRNISIARLNDALESRGFQISNRYGPLKEKTFRIAHMGDVTLTEIKELLDAVESSIQE